MIVTARRNVGSEISLPKHGSGYSARTRFPIDVGQDYVVYGLMMWRGDVSVLVDCSPTVGNDAHPAWLPVLLFDVKDPSLPSGWVFCRDNEPAYGEPVAVWGYPLLATNRNYRERMVDRDPDALRSFVEHRDGAHTAADE